MSESPEKPRLSGLARSIDALFSAGPAPDPAAPARAAPTLVASEPLLDPQAAPDEPAGSDSDETMSERPPSRVEERPPLAEAFPASQMLEAISVPPPAWALDDAPPAEPTVVSAGAEPMPESLLTFDAPFALPLAAPEPAAASTDVSADLPKEAPSGEPPATTHATAADPDRLRDAVDAFIAGDRDARERIETSAAALRDRLALDPLADAVESLVRAAGDPPHPGYIDVASAVINPAVASRLVQRMGRERDDAKREEYFALCRRLGRVMANGLKGALTGRLEPTVRRTYYDAMISMGDVSRPVIEGMLEDENRLLARDAVLMLGEIGGPRAVELVTTALANTDPRVRAEALHALAGLGDADAGRLALGFLEDSDANVRLAAAVAAGKLRIERALRPILNLLDEEEASDRKVLLLQALGELGDPGAVPAIEKHASPSLFTKTGTDLRVAAYRALHRIGSPHARELVRLAANDKDPGVRAALRGLAQES